MTKIEESQFSDEVVFRGFRTATAAELQDFCQQKKSVPEKCTSFENQSNV